MTEIATLLRDGATALAQAGIEGARGEARLLLEAAAGISRARQIGYPEEQVASAVADRFHGLVRRRAKREPISRILGQREFWSLPFLVCTEALDPRPDSEILVAMVLEELSDRQAAWRILDLGAGTGCLLLALLSELPFATGHGIDRESGAIDISLANARRLDLANRSSFEIGDWMHWSRPGWDVVICNPPYIPTDLIRALEPEVSLFEPLGALDGGQDGLSAYRQVLPLASRLLNPDGIVCVEFGKGQEQAVRDLGLATGLCLEKVGQDLAGRPRAAVFRRSRDQELAPISNE